MYYRIVSVVRSLRIASDLLRKSVRRTTLYARSDRIKALLWEGDGFLLLYKRIETGRIQWPRDASEVRELTDQQYRWLMEGLTVEQKKVIPQVPGFALKM